MNDTFELTYRNYLDQLGSINMGAKLELLGIQHKNGTYTVCYFGNEYMVSSGGVELGKKTPDFTTNIVLLKYLLHPQTINPEQTADWQPYRSFKDSKPLVHYFQKNGINKIETHFTNGLSRLQNAAENLHGSIIQNDGYDFSVQFQILPRIQLYLLFNDGDETFPPACSLLYKSSAAYYLDMECLAITGVQLADKLIELDNQ